MERFLKEALAAASAGVLWESFVGYFARQGLDIICYIHFPRAGSPEMAQSWVRAKGFPPDWLEQTNGQLFEHDPVCAQAAIHPVPFKWSDVGRMRQLTPEEEAFHEDAVRLGLVDGIAIPVFGPAGRHGYAGIAFPAGVDDVEPCRLLHFQIVSQYMHQRYCELVPLKEKPSVLLSPREQEVLRWVAQGKSNSVIADILGVSTNTVDTHLRRIYQKLKVGDRVSAALAGLGHGIITLE